MKKLIAAMTAMLMVVALAGSAFAAGGASTIYNSLLPNPLHGNQPSVGPEAYAFSEIGNDVAFTGKNRSLSSVTVTMSSWGCQTRPLDHWRLPDHAGRDIRGADDVQRLRRRAVIASSTKTFAIPFRPSASPKCTDGQDGSTTR